MNRRPDRNGTYDVGLFPGTPMNAGMGSTEKDSHVPLRVGIVPYCNAWPLVHFLQSELNGAILSPWVPSAMRLRLMAYHLDLALMPVAELMNLPYGKIVGNCCIACRGEVRSVKMFSRKPIEKIDSLALDTASRSSITMCELILRHFYDRRPTRYRLHDEKPLEQCKSDALVVIGDRALSYRDTEYWDYQYDLGALWHEKTGLPFVFAAWIGCSERLWNDDQIVRSLESARDRGVRSVDTILDEKERDRVPFPVSRPEMHRYLTDSIVYRLDREEQLGLQSFFDLALLHGMTKHRTVVEVLESTSS